MNNKLILFLGLILVLVISGIPGFSAPGILQADTGPVAPRNSNDTGQLKREKFSQKSLPDIPSFSPDCSTDRSFCARSNNPNFRAGENLVWKVTYLGLTAGYLRARVVKSELKGRSVFKLVLTAKSSGAMSWMYDIQDKLVSFMDVRGLFSWGYNYFQNHNAEKEVEKVRYYQQQGFFVHNEGSRGELPAYTQDALSAVYYLRTQNLVVGEKYSFPLQVGEDTGRMILKVKKVDKIATYSGWKDAYLVETILETKNVNKEAAEKVENLKIWLSKDERKVPYQIDVDAYFGSLYAYLQEYQPGLSGD